MHFRMIDPDRPIVTYGLTLLNVLIFGVMLVFGVHAGNPDPDHLIQWGANFGPVTLANQWWRLVTCMFLHGGVLHILCNMYALYCLGPIVERMVGRAFFILIYFVSGVTGSLASVWWNPLAVSVGASGAIFGIFGALLTFVYLYRHFIAREAVAALRKNAILVLALNFLLGYTVKAIDMAAHVGGFLGGIIACALLCHPPRPLWLKTRYLRMLGALGAALIVTVTVYVTLPRSIVTVNRFFQTEHDIQTTFNRILNQANETDMNDQEFAVRFERQVLQPWHQAQERFENACRQLPKRVQRQFDRFRRYVEITGDYWETTYKTLLATNDQQREIYGQKLKEIQKRRKEFEF